MLRYRISDLAAGSDVQSVQINKKLRLVGLLVSVVIDSIVDNCSANICITRSAATPTFAAGSEQLTRELARVCIGGNFVTSGMDKSSTNLLIPCDDGFDEGEYLYVHSAVSANTLVTYNVIAIFK